MTKLVKAKHIATHRAVMSEGYDHAEVISHTRDDEGGGYWILVRAFLDWTKKRSRKTNVHEHRYGTWVPDNAGGEERDDIFAPQFYMKRKELHGKGKARRSGGRSRWRPDKSASQGEGEVHSGGHARRQDAELPRRKVVKRKGSQPRPVRGS